MQTKTETIPPLQDLKHLPAYAGYLLTHRLTEFTEEQHRLAIDLDLPILKQLGNLSREELIRLGEAANTEFLGFLADNKVGNPEMKAARKLQREHQIEKVGAELRGMMPWIGKNKLVDKAKN